MAEVRYRIKTSFGLTVTLSADDSDPDYLKDIRKQQEYYQSEEFANQMKEAFYKRRDRG